MDGPKDIRVPETVMAGASALSVVPATEMPFDIA